MLDGSNGIVTGASAGIGRATTEALAAEGVSLAIAARREERLEALASTLEDEHDVRVHPIATDVGDSGAVTDLVTTARERFDELDLVVHNAGTGVRGSVCDVSDEAFRTILDTNVAGTFYVTREVLPALRESGGTLVYVGSLAGQVPFAANPIYAGTKGWVRQFAHSVEAREGSEGVAVSIVNPGGVRTDFEFGDGSTQRERYEPGEAPEPEEIAETIVFAASRTDATTIHELDVYRRDQLAPE